METKTYDGSPSFSTEILQPSDSWFHHLLYLFLCVLLFRVARALGIVNHLHRQIIVVCSLLTTSGRQLRAERRQLRKELQQLRAELQNVSMTAEFARYSRIERRIKATNRRLSSIAPETFGVSLIRAVSISISLFIIEALLLGWLVNRTPKLLVSSATVDSTSGDSLLSWLVRFLYHVPAKLAVVIWIALCHCGTNPAIAWLTSHLSRSKPPSSNIPDDALTTNVSNDKFTKLHTE